MCHFGFSQIINEPTHVLNNTSSCIDLIFTSQSNLVMYSGVDPSLHPNCHHINVIQNLILKYIALLHSLVLSAC